MSNQLLHAGDTVSITFRCTPAAPDHVLASPWQRICAKAQSWLALHHQRPRPDVWLPTETRHRVWCAARDIHALGAAGAVELSRIRLGITTHGGTVSPARCRAHVARLSPTVAAVTFTVVTVDRRRIRSGRRR